MFYALFIMVEYSSWDKFSPWYLASRLGFLWLCHQGVVLPTSGDFVLPHLGTLSHLEILICHILRFGLCFTTVSGFVRHRRWLCFAQWGLCFTTASGFLLSQMVTLFCPMGTLLYPMGTLFYPMGTLLYPMGTLTCTLTVSASFWLCVAQ